MPRSGGRAKKGTIVARIQVGVEETEWHWLCDLAQNTDCTVSEVVREILRDAYKSAVRDL